MESSAPESYLARAAALDVDGIPWDDVPRHRLPAGAVRTLCYMQDIESHTIIYLRTLLGTRAVDDPEIATFLAAWFVEETSHGLALARFLAAAGHPVTPRPRSRTTVGRWLDARASTLLASIWPAFPAVHMTWGAINELTTLIGYQRLAAVADHPVLSTLLTRIVRDESKHFGFYFHQAERRLADPPTARIVRFLVDHYWAPVGSGEQPAEETRFLAGYLLSGADGRVAARRVDSVIRRLPGFADVRLLEAWIERALGEPEAPPAPGALSLAI
jgi:hypothetical protein